MNILRLAAELFLIYILYKLIFEFIIPVYQSTKKIRKQFSDMHNKMQNDMNSYQGPPKSPQPARSQNTSQQQKEGDYIEFEEVK